MELKWTVNPYLPATQQRHLVYLLIEIDPGEAEAGEGTPLHLSLVVDSSRSMSVPILTEAQFHQLAAQGMAQRKIVDGVQVWQFQVPRGYHVDAPSNMDFTKEALRIVAGRLRPLDRFSLVAFAEDALLMVGNTPGSEEEELVHAVDRLDQIDLGDETFMARGIEMGLKQAAQAGTARAVNRMIVLTDGYTKDEGDCYRLTRQARQEGIVVSTMGLGMDFNESLLISLADVSGGHAYFVDDPQEIPDAFRRELAGAQSVAWRDLSLSLEMPADVSLRRAHKVRPEIAPIGPEAVDADQGLAVLALGDLEAPASGSPGGLALLLEWIVPPRPAGTYRLAQVGLRARGANSDEVQEIDAQDVIVRYTERPSLAKQTDLHLMSVIQKVSAFKLQAQAMEDARRGNVVGATKRLRAAGQRLVEMGEEDLGQTMLVEAELMEKEGQMSAEGTKKLRYGTRKLR
jgi:Ca-activated chloride channel family protein